MDHLTLKNPTGILFLLLIKKNKETHRDRSQDEFKKSNPPTFDGEVKNGQEAEAWLLGIKKYFQVQGLFREHEGQSFHIQFEWTSIHLVGTLQASKKDQ